jgi:hypothetical protein
LDSYWVSNLVIAADTPSSKSTVTTALDVREYSLKRILVRNSGKGKATDDVEKGSPAAVPADESAQLGDKDNEVIDEKADKQSN